MFLCTHIKSACTFSFLTAILKFTNKTNGQLIEFKMNHN